MIKTVGSVCSGIEAASVALAPLGLEFEWLSEIAEFPSRLLAERYPSIPNVGDMNAVPELITNKKIPSADFICGGTPCQPFSLAGWKGGLDDSRGDLTLKFADIVNANDEVRLSRGEDRCKVLWENVEGVLTDKTNAFGCFISSLAGLENVLTPVGGKWSSAGLIYGKTRNIAWRVFDAKYFGVPQQRRRLYVVAGGLDFYPERVLFEVHKGDFQSYPDYPLKFKKDGHEFEVFRGYTDCLYSAYGTKWNGNAAAYNGSLFVVQDGRIRRLSPLEAERLMGLPDNYTDIQGAKKTNRYQVIGNSWAVPVIRWIGERILKESGEECGDTDFESVREYCAECADNVYYADFGIGLVPLKNGACLNCTAVPEECNFTSMKDIVSPEAMDDIYISPVGCGGIIRRSKERHIKINPQLENVLISISEEMSPDEIESRSRIQRRGRFSTQTEGESKATDKPISKGRDIDGQLSLLA